MNYIITKNKSFFEKIGDYNYCDLNEMQLPKKYGYDSETTGLKALKDKVFSIQIGTGTNNYLIDLQDYNTALFTEEKYVLKDIIPYLKTDESILVGHNLAFDLSFLYVQGCFPKFIRDTMIGSKILHNGEPAWIKNSFGEVMEREMNLDYDKSEQKNICKTKLSTQKAIKYCFNDVDKILDLEDNLYKKLLDYGATETYLLNCDYIKAMTYMELCGLPVSKHKWLQKMEEDRKSSLKSQYNITEYIYNNLPQYRDNQFSLFETIKKINPLLSSPKQMIPVFKDLGINTTDDKGKESIEENVLNKSTHEFVDIWLGYKESQHRVTTFGEKILDKIENGRLYTRFNPIIDTCRISTRKGEINFLNFPSDSITRDCFVASKGFKMIVCDYDNQEARVLADKSQNTNALKVVLEGADAHCILAREIFSEIRELSDKEIKSNHNDKRQIGKIANFTFAYGGNGYTAAKNLNIPIEEGDRIYNAYKTINKETFDWGEVVFKKAIHLGYIESADGFKLKLPYYEEYKLINQQIKQFSQDDWELYKMGKVLYKDNTTLESVLEREGYDFYLTHKDSISKAAKARSQYFRLCLNNPIQATSAHQTKRAMVNLFEFIVENNHLRKARITNVPHDEIVMEVIDALVPFYQEHLGRIMREAGDYYMKSGIIKMGATANIGLTWLEAK